MGTVNRMFRVESHVYGYLQDPQLPALLVQLAKMSLREEGMTIDTVKKRLWDFLKQRFGSRYFQRLDARGWMGGKKRNNYGLHLYVPGKINIILGCIRVSNNLRLIRWEGRLERLSKEHGILCGSRKRN